MKKSIFLFFAAILCTMSAWALNQSNVDLYFDNSTAQWESCNVYIGHGSYTSCYAMKRVPGTQYLWILAKGFNNGNAWDNASGWVVSKDNWWASSDENVYKFVYHGNKNVTDIRTTAWDANTIYKAEGTQSVNHYSTACIVYKWATSTKSNYTVTINTVTGGTLTVKDYDNATVSNGASKIKLTVLKFSATPASGYVFDGVQINNGSTTTTYTAADVTSGKTYTLTSAVTITPVWRATTSTVTVTATATNGTVTGGGVVEEGTSVTLTATAADGYQFVNWTIGGAEVSTANPYTFTAVEDVTIVANFEELPKETVYFINTNKWTGTINAYAWTDGSPKVENAGWAGLPAKKEDFQIGDYEVYSYTAVAGKYANVIFNGKLNGGDQQTADLTWSEGVDKYYIHNYNGNTGWYTQAEAEAMLVVIPDYYITGNKALVNKDTEWQANEIKMTYSPDTKIWSHEFSSLTVGTEYQLKITTGSWEEGHSNWGYSAVKNSADGVIDMGGNVGFTLTTAGKVTVTFDGTNITVTTTGAFYVPVIYDYYIVGEMNSWSPNENYGLSDDNTDGVYEKELTWAAGTYIFKINVGDWGSQWGWSHVEGEYKEVQNANEDNKIKVVLDAEKTFTVKLDPTNNKISFAGLTRPGRYLTGNDAVFGYTDGNWTPNTIQMTWDDVNGIYTYTTPTLSANKNYVFRVTDGTWDGKQWNYEKLNQIPDNVLSFGDDKNICFMLASAGTITVTLDGDKLGLTTSSSFAAPVYTLVGDAAITGVHWDENSAENQMVQDATDKNKFTLVKTVKAVAGEYEYKAIRNHSYEWEVAGDKVKIEKDGTGKITYTLDIATPKLTAAVSDWVEESVAQVVTLKGIGEDKDFTEATNGKTTSVNVTLAANQVYKFDIVVNSVYMKNAGTMWRKNCTDWEFTNDANSGHIITDLAGTYTFTWTYEGNKLSVTYPDGTNVPAPVFLKGNMNEWNDYSKRLIPSADGKTASVTVELTRNEVNEFGIILGTDYLSNTGQMTRGNCTGWTFVQLTGDDAGKNASILPDATGEYTFTWTYEGNELSVTYPAEECTACSGFYLVGEMNSWNQLADEFMTISGTTIEVSVELAAGDHEFKIKKADTNTWYSDEDLTITRSNSSAIAFNATDNENTTITADVAGVYVFSFTTDSKKLTVTYPYTRDVTVSTYGTICLPYASSNHTGATFYQVIGKETDKVVIETVDKLEAGMPYIFMATDSKIVVSYEGSPVATAQKNNGLYGTFVDNTPVAAGNYIVYNNKLQLCGTGCYVNANRAYVVLGDVPSGVPAQVPGRQRVALGIQGENAATGVDNLTENGIIAPAMQGVYDIMGRRLAEPTTTGFYIINGKKVFVVK